MGVLRLRVVGVEVGEAHVGDGLPVARGGLNVAVELMVEGMLLDAVEELQRTLQRLSVARGTHIFRHAVEREADGVELLLRVLRLPLVVQAPEDAALLGVEEVVDDVVFGPSGCREVFRLAQHAVGRRERPEDARVEDGTFVGCLHELAVAGHLSVESPVLFIHHILQPETQDVVFQYILHLGLHCVYKLFHFLFRKYSPPVLKGLGGFIS